EPPMGTHFVELLKDSTFNNNTIGGYKMRYSVRIEWFSDYEIGDRCGVGRHKVVLNQNAVFVE
ncbi:MAG: hypothetical protein IJD28_07230, partial [Deferribacterales bacterium]|nr:hypothetical protein [Deferribacterales bacterium]